jgi:hypothetical protein
MQFRNDRRRRVLADELAQAQPARSSKEARLTPPERAEVYTDEARHDRQPRLVDFIPQRNLSFSLLGLAAIAAISGLETLYLYRAQIANWLGDDAVLAFDVAQRTSLAQWALSAGLAAASVLALMIYSLRRWRVDDYHRRYRVWLLAAVACFAFSVDATTPMFAVGHPAMRFAAQASHVSSETLTAVLAIAVLLTATLRLWFEVRRSRASLVAWITTCCCLLSAIVAGSGWLSSIEPVYLAVLGSVAQLVAVTALLFTLAFYERFLLLEVEGRLQQRVRREKKPRKAPAATEPDQAEQPNRAKPPAALRTDLEPVNKEKPAAPAAKEPVAAPAPKPKLQWESTASPPAQQLSRTDRKKLKREMRKQAA